MKVVILAGGYGTRISEESQVRPKPLVEIGGRPIIWHIMKIYAHYGLTDFVVCCGYKGDMLKTYFRDFMSLSGQVTFDLARNTVHAVPEQREPWRVTLVDTGEATMTGGRLKRVRHLLTDTFCLTYGDGVSDVDIAALLDHHRKGGVAATVTAVLEPGRFGALHLSPEHKVNGFREKGAGDGGFINGGFFVMEPSVIDQVDGDDTVLEREPMDRLVELGQLQAFVHRGFWQPMDSLRDKMVLEKLWQSGEPPWRIWDRPRSKLQQAGALLRAV